MPDQTPDDLKLDIDWLKTAAGALAAVTTAVLLSTLGAVGTLIGAALGSVAATIGTALYAQGLARSKAAVAKAQLTAMNKVGVAQAEVRRAERRAGDDEAVEAHLEAADDKLSQAKVDMGEVAEQAAPAPWIENFKALPWKRVALLAGAMFIIVVLAITAFEALTGESISSRTGGSDGQGTTIGGVTNDDNGSKNNQDEQQDQDQPSDEATPSESATSEAPTTEPTGTPSADPTESVTPTPSPTPTPTPSATATP